MCGPPVHRTGTRARGSKTRNFNCLQGPRPSASGAGRRPRRRYGGGPSVSQPRIGCPPTLARAATGSLRAAALEPRSVPVQPRPMGNGAPRDEGGGEVPARTQPPRGSRRYRVNHAGALGRGTRITSNAEPRRRAMFHVKHSRPPSRLRLPAGRVLPSFPAHFPTVCRRAAPRLHPSQFQGHTVGPTRPGDPSRRAIPRSGRRCGYPITTPYCITCYYIHIYYTMS